MTASGRLTDVLEDSDVKNALENLYSFHDTRFDRLLGLFRIVETKSKSFEFDSNYISSLPTATVFDFLQKEQILNEMLCFQSQRIVKEFQNKLSSESSVCLEDLELSSRMLSLRRRFTEKKASLRVRVDSHKTSDDDRAEVLVAITFRLNDRALARHDESVAFADVPNLLNVEHNRICLKNLLRSIIIRRSESCNVRPLIQGGLTLARLLHSLLRCLLSGLYLDASDPLFHSFVLRPIDSFASLERRLIRHRQTLRLTVRALYTRVRGPAPARLSSVWRTKLVFYRIQKYLNLFVLVRLELPAVFLNKPSQRSFYEHGIKLSLQRVSCKSRILGWIRLSQGQYDSLRLLLQPDIQDFLISRTVSTPLTRLLDFLSHDRIISHVSSRPGEHSLNDLLYLVCPRHPFFLFCVWLILPDWEFELVMKGPRPRLISALNRRQGARSKCLFQVLKNYLTAHANRDKIIQNLSHLGPYSLSRCKLFQNKAKIYRKFQNRRSGPRNSRFVSGQSEATSPLRLCLQLVRGFSSLRPAHTVRVPRPSSARSFSRVDNKKSSQIEWPKLPSRVNLETRLLWRRPIQVQLKARVGVLDLKFAVKTKQGRFLRIRVRRLARPGSKGAHAKRKSQIFRCSICEDASQSELLLSCADLSSFFGVSSLERPPKRSLVDTFQVIFSYLSKNDERGRIRPPSRSTNSTDFRGARRTRKGPKSTRKCSQTLNGFVAINKL